MEIWKHPKVDISRLWTPGRRTPASDAGAARASDAGVVRPEGEQVSNAHDLAIAHGFASKPTLPTKRLSIRVRVFF